MEENAKNCCRPGQRCCGAAPVMIAVVIVMLTCSVWLGLKARNESRQYKFIGVPLERDTISVSGEGRVSVKPDIVKLELGTVIERKTVAEAQKENTRIMNALSEKLKGFGVDAQDLQTSNYTINPMYDWNDGRQKLRGYQVQQGLRLKLRDLDKVGDVLGAAGELGVNQAGGIEFTVDKPEAVKQQAREEAMKNAQAKAEALAKVTGIKLRRVISFNEGGYEPTYNAMYNKAVMMDSAAGSAPAPTIQAGSAEYVINANVTYEIE
jgi:uncharacterized protein YggE